MAPKAAGHSELAGSGYNNSGASDATSRHCYVHSETQGTKRRKLNTPVNVHELELERLDHHGFSAVDQSNTHECLLGIPLHALQKFLSQVRARREIGKPFYKRRKPTGPALKSPSGCQNLALRPQPSFGSATPRFQAN